MALNTSTTDFQRHWQELLARAEPPEWVREMIEHYRRTGTYRPEDLRRLMGNPTKGIEVGPDISLSCLLASRRAALGD
jgi:hypothetical protein